MNSTALSRSFDKSHWIIFALGFLLVMLALILRGKPSPAEQPKEAAPAVALQVIRPKRGAITRTVTLPGEVKPYQQATLYAKVAGYLKSISVDKGDRAKKGDLIGRIFDGKITRFSYALDEATKTMLAEIELPNAKLELRPGMYAIVKIGIERKDDALLLPVEAVVVERAGAFVFTVSDTKAKKIQIKTGFNDGAQVEIISGLSSLLRSAVASGEQQQTPQRLMAHKAACARF